MDTGCLMRKLILLGIVFLICVSFVYADLLSREKATWGNIQGVTTNTTSINDGFNSTAWVGNDTLSAAERLIAIDLNNSYYIFEIKIREVIPNIDRDINESFQIKLNYSNDNSTWVTYSPDFDCSSVFVDDDVSEVCNITLSPDLYSRYFVFYNWSTNDGGSDISSRVGEIEIYGSTELRITHVYPTNNSFVHYDGWLNFTTQSNATCSLNDTDWLRNTTISTNQSHFYFNIDYASLTPNEYSIDINCYDINSNVSEILVFDNYNYTVSFTEPDLETATSQFNIVFKSDIISLWSGNLVYNNTAYSMEKTTTGTITNLSKSITLPLASITYTKYPFYFNYSYDTFIKTTSEKNQTIYRMAIDNCTDYGNMTLNVTFIDEVNKNLTTVSNFDVYFKFWYGSESDYRTYSVSVVDVDTYKFCINPDFGNLTTDYDFQYQAAGYDTRNYNVRSGLLTNDTIQLNLTLLSTGNSTAITITVEDGFENPLSGKVVEAYKYDLGTNSYTLVSTEETDTNGQVIMYLDTTYKHRFYVKDSYGNIEFIQEAMTLVSTSYTFTVTDETTTTYQNLFTLDRTLQIPGDEGDNTQYLINYTWDDSTTNLINRICLDVSNSTIQNVSFMYHNCSTSDSGTMAYLLLNKSGYFTISGYVYATADGARYSLDSGSMTIRPEYDIFDKEGVLYAFLFIGTMAFLGLSSTFVIGSGGAIVCIIMMMFATIVMRSAGFFNIGIGTMILGFIMGLVIIGIIGGKK